MFRRPLLLLLFAFVFLPELRAQIEVDLQIKRRLFLVYEPILADVSITNLTGRDIMLQDYEGHRWFSFQITTTTERLVPPDDPFYQLTPLKIPAGRTVKRAINIASLYGVREFGSYRVRASVYFADLDRYFSSPLRSIEVTEGKLVWHQVVGVPDGFKGAGEYRALSLLTHRLAKDNMLYVRVENRDQGVVYSTYQLGRVLHGSPPQVELDVENRLHVFHLVGPKTYLYSRIGLNGEWLGQQSFIATNPRAGLRRKADGSVGIGGAYMDVPRAIPVDGEPPPKLSDRPPDLPQQ